MGSLGTPRIRKTEDRIPEDLLQPPPENDVYLHLKDVKEGVFVKYDWIFLNDRILFVRMAGIGIFVAKNVTTSYSQILGRNTASALIKHLKELRRRKVSTLSDQDIVNVLTVDRRNTEMLYSDMDRVRLERKLFAGYRLTVSCKSVNRRADIPWTRVSHKKMVLFFKGRAGSRFFDR